MPVRKFRSIEEMGDHWYERGDPALVQAIRGVWNFAARTIQPHFPPGVYKHRTIEDANVQNDRWAERNFDAFQARRKR
jgi:hypothetical protein